METPITKQIADRLEELAVQWKDHTSQAEALMMAAKEVMTFQEEEKEQAEQYAEFAVECDRKGLPILMFDAWIDINTNENGGNK